MKAGTRSPLASGALGAGVLRPLDIFGTGEEPVALWSRKVGAGRDCLLPCAIESCF